LSHTWRPCSDSDMVLRLINCRIIIIIIIIMLRQKTWSSFVTFRGAL